jgi:hydrogenase-1 operon protein HyaF
VSRLSEIPVRVEGLVRTSAQVPTAAVAATPAPALPGLGGGIAAILSELATLLERLATQGESAMIDLSSLPMSDNDRIELQRVLGTGEVCATLDAQGLSTVRETGFAGVWWIDHRNASGEPLAELLEVGLCPQILASAPDEVLSAAGALRARNSLVASPLGTGQPVHSA